MPDRRLIGDLIRDQHAWSETDMSDQRPTHKPNRRHIGDRLVWLKTHQRPTCLIKGLKLFQYISISKKYMKLGIFIYICVKIPIGLHRHVGLHGSPIRHVGLRWNMSRFLMGLRSGMLVSDESPMGLQWLSHRSSIKIIFSWTHWERPNRYNLTDKW